MSPEDIAAVSVGTRIAHSDGSVCVVARRKGDDSGWWTEGGGGLSDRALTSDDWSLLHDDRARLLPGKESETP